METKRLEEAMCGLRGWRNAGEQYANQGGSLMTLDDQVDVVLDEIEWRLDPENALEEEIERPDEDQIKWAVDEIKAHFNDGPLGEDLQVVCSFLKERSLSSER